MSNKATQFQQKVYKAVRRIPHGQVATYKQIAKAINKPNSARAVGNALNKSPGEPYVPCHRVVRSDKKVGGYAKGVQKKKDLLTEEGAKIKNGKVGYRA